MPVWIICKNSASNIFPQADDGMTQHLNDLLLCFGDSNTWGFNPAGGRYPAAQRWPQQLAARLHLQLQVDGQPGRTLRYERRSLGLVSGFADWQQALGTRPHRILLALGINDLAAGATPRQCGEALDTYLQLWQSELPSSTLWLIAPAPLGNLTAGWQTLFADQQAASHELATIWQSIARDWGINCYQVPASFVPGSDGLHWSAEFHTQLADDLATQLATTPETGE
jgi:lysophospholipase L1-like esterase